MTAELDVDAALARLGKFGKWQMCIYVLICLSVTWSGCWQMMVIVFVGGEPEHHCRIPDSSLLNESIPLETRNGKQVYSRCKRYQNFSLGNLTTDCGDLGWTYDDDFDSTIVTDWDLVCDRNVLMETSQSVFTFGVMLGALSCTTLADKIGRKPIHLGCQWAMILIGVATAFSPNFIVFTVLRFLQGVAREGAGLSGIVMACELFPAAQRTFAGTTLELFWAAAWMVLALMAYFIRDWRNLQLAVSLPPVLTIALFWLLPESIPWLAANKKVDKAEQLLLKAAKVNKVNLPEHPLSPQDEEKIPLNDVTMNKKPVTEDSDEDLRVSKSKCCGISRNAGKDWENYTCLDIGRSRAMLEYCVIMCFLWFTTSLIYYGLSLSTSQLAGNRYVNFSLSGAVEAPAYMSTIFVLQRFGRRWPLFIVHIICGVVLATIVFIPEQTGSGVDLTPLIVTLSMVGKFAITFSFGTAVLYAPEIFPTNIRNIGFGLASCWGRIGGMLAPFSAYIGKSQSWIPSMVFSILSVLAGFLVLLLPETLNQPLPQTLEDVENWKKSKRDIQHIHDKGSCTHNGKSEAV